MAVFACKFLQRHYQLLELMIEDTGIIFPLKNPGTIDL